MQLRRVAEHLQRRGGQLRLEADRGVERAAHELQGLGDDAAEIDGDALAALAAAISEDLVDQAARAVRCGENVLRSEEHTSELQSRSDLVCRLLLEKKK